MKQFYEKSHNWQVFEEGMRALPEYATWITALKLCCEIPTLDNDGLTLDKKAYQALKKESKILYEKLRNERK